MNKRERTSRLKEIVSLIDTTLNHIEEDSSLDDAIEILNTLQDTASDFSSSIDFDDIQSNMLEDYFDFMCEDIVDMFEGFKDELEDYISELSEAKQEKLEEDYGGLDDVQELLEFDSSRITSKEDLISDLDEMKDSLKEMM